MRIKRYVLMLLVIPILFLVGCTMANTPTSKVEALFNKYQTLDGDIRDGIDHILEEQEMEIAQKDRYKDVIEKQYKNLTYQIKEELIDGDTATVVAEVEVVDLKKAISDLVFDSTIYTKNTYDEEKLNRLENAKDRVKYTLEFSLSKDNDGEWKIDALTNEQIKKIQGMY